MKTRNGFVSNSSTSSFLIAIKKPEVCPHCGCTPIDFLKTLQISDNKNNKDYEFSDLDVNDYISTQKDELEELNKDRNWILKKIKLYEKLLNDKKLAEGIQTFNLVLEDLNDKKRGFKNYIRDNRWFHDEDNSVLDTVKSQIKRLSTVYVDKKIKEITEIITQLEKLNSDDVWTLFNIDIDYMRSNKTINNAIDIILESKQAVLIKKEKN